MRVIGRVLGPDRSAVVQRIDVGRAVAIVTCIVWGPILTVHLVEEASRLMRWGGC